jgi:serine/threonine-protein kinase
VSEPVATTADAELRAHVTRVLGPHYEIENELGRGGMGIVYCARDRRLKRTVAIKLLPPELAFRSDIRSRFLREAETAAQLSHPNIVPIYSVDEMENLVFFVMAFVDGKNLALQLHEKGRLGIGETRRVMREVADALAFAHARGVVHRDVKPDNVLLEKESGRAMVTDFGIARAVSDSGDSRLTATGMAIGTPAYMSPEQAAGERDIDGRSDLYALGIVAYQMLTGAPPFTAASTPAMLVKHLTERPQAVRARRGDVPADLERIVMVLLEKDPANRLPSAQALVAALDGAPVAAAPIHVEPAVQPGSYPVRREAAAPPVQSPNDLSQETLARWNAPEILGFRKRVRKWAVAAPIFLVMGIIFHFPALMVVGIWGISLAWNFSGLVSKGYSWRDVLQQPPEKQLVDVLGDAVEGAQSVFDSEKRTARRLERQQQRDARRSRGLLTAGRDASTSRSSYPSAPSSSSPVPQPTSTSPIPVTGIHGSVVSQAQIDRDEIKRLIDSMTGAERGLVANVVPSADALLDRVRTLAASLEDVERNVPRGALDAIEREISKLESEANPLERERSEERVRRLAGLRRQRRAMSDLTARRDQMATRLESCSLALQNMRFDVLRLRAGAQSHAQVTSLALEALNLAREVEYAVAAGEDVARLTSNTLRGSAGR